MEKKYQVFVSSTYTDLQDERREVIQALLELDCIPVGMELFPAADEDQWSFIKSVIDDCDYYIVILAGRYGSCAKDGRSYTEMEYRYAAKTEIPTIAFVHEDPSSLPVNKTDDDAQKKEKLDEFRALVRNKLCKDWSTAAQLSGVVSRSIVQLRKRSPAVGWVKADAVPGEGASREILKLRARIEELESNLTAAVKVPPPGSEKFAQGDDTITVTSIVSHAGKVRFGPVVEYNTELTWNLILSYLGPHMMDECTEYKLRYTLCGLIKDVEQLESKADVDPSENQFQKIKVQLKALGLMEMSARKRAVTDTDTYWTLTPLGDDLLTRLMAIKRDVPPSPEY